MKKILFVSIRDISNPNVLSGTPYFIIKHLKQIAEVDIFDKLVPQRKIFFYKHIGFFWRFAIAKLIQIFWKIFKKLYNWETSWLLTQYYASQVNAYLKKNPDYSFIFGDKASPILAFIKTSIPIIYMSDATVKLMINYYPGFTNLPQFHLKFLDKLERNSIRKAYKCIYRSQWAATSAIQDYQKIPTDVEVCSLGPNVHANYLDIDVEDCITKKCLNSKVKLLLIGVDWKRKGCTQAVKVAQQLNEKKIKAELTICGATPPETMKLQSYLKIIPYIKKTKEEGLKELASLYMQANFFLFPVKAECLGISIIEAMAFCCPILSTNQGGIPEYVTDKNGCISDNTENYVIYIIKLIKNKKLYKQACRNSYRTYVNRCSWSLWKNRIESIIGT